MRRRPVRLACAFLLLCAATMPAFSQSSADTAPVPYEQDEFPQWARDLRRFEIITLGSLPFTLLGTTMGYSGIMFATGNIASFPNPFDKASSVLSEQDRFAILGIACGVSLGIGVADLVIRLVRRSKESRSVRAFEEQHGQVTVTPMQAGDLLRRGNLMLEGQGAIF